MAKSKILYLEKCFALGTLLDLYSVLNYLRETYFKSNYPRAIIFSDGSGSIVVDGENERPDTIISFSSTMYGEEKLTVKNVKYYIAKTKEKKEIVTAERLLEINKMVVVAFVERQFNSICPIIQHFQKTQIITAGEAIQYKEILSFYKPVEKEMGQYWWEPNNRQARYTVLGKIVDELTELVHIEKS